MCGIVGVVGAYCNGFTNDEQGIFRDMLFVDTLRGFDSTGVFMVTNKGNVHIRKAAMHGADFIINDAWKELKAKSYTQGLFMVGHNRAATRGDVNDQNAHPFWPDDKIVLVQNGTYLGSHKHLKDTEVDTDAIAHVIAESDDIEGALQRINAAYALVWFDVKNKTLNLIRNDQRPLYLARTSTDGYLFASEDSTIWYAVARNSTKLKGTPKLLEPYELHTFTINNRGGYDYNSRAIDAKYRYKHDTEASFPSSNDDDDWYNYWIQRSAGGGQRHNFYEIGTAKDNKEIEWSIYDYIKADKFTEFGLYTEDDYRNAHRKSQFSNGERVIVELKDYLAVYPADRDCDAWYVYGELILPNNDDGTPGPMIYTRISSMDEKDVLDMVTKNPIVEGRAIGGGVTHFVDYGKPGNYRLITCFISNMEQFIQDEDEEAVAQAH